MPAEGDSVVRFVPASLLAGVLFWGTSLDLHPEELAQRLRLYVITDAQAARGRDLVRLIASALDGGATAVQLRAKSGSTLAQVELGRELRRLTRDAGALFLVNDRVDVAYAVSTIFVFNVSAVVVFPTPPLRFATTMFMEPTPA